MRSSSVPLPLSCIVRRAIVFLLLSSSNSGGGRGGVGVVDALPRNQNNGSGNNNNEHDSTHSLNSSLMASRRRDRDGGAGGSRSSVALRDSFPCEASFDQQSQPAEAASTGADAAANSSASAANNSSAATAAPSASSNTNASYLSRNSFMAQNNLEGAEPSSSPISSHVALSALLSSRGGGASSSSVDLDDDELDQMVENLIAGLDDEEEETDSEEADEEEEDDSETEAAEETEEEEEEYDSNIPDADSDVEEEEEVEVEGGNSESDEEEQEEEEAVDAAKRDNSQLSAPSLPRDNSNINRGSRPPPQSQSHSPTTTMTTTPTNAYYRFLVRRGPKGHILAAFTLIAVQWIHTYLPQLYQSIATILLKLRIYNPQLLWERDRKRQYELRYGKPKKKGLTSKLFGSTSSSSSKSKQVASQQKKAMVKQADEDATTKLKQLYKTMKDGSGTNMLSEVKYRYLGVGFRRRHGLGKEYRVEKPRTFMGEMVEGGVPSVGLGDESVSSIGMDEVEMVFSDAELEDEAGAGEAMVSGNVKGAQNQQTGTSSQQQQQQRRPKRKKINDWVVKAFASRPKPTTAAVTNKNQKQKSSNSDELWTLVGRGAIMEAAWASRAAEQLVMTKGGKRRGVGGANDREGSNKGGPDGANISKPAASSSSGSSSGYGASKVFKSVMTRTVGSNGRIFGAYPNDALPVEECSNARGVLDLARRYGYGEWMAMNDNDHHYLDGDSDADDGDENDAWGGGLNFGGVDDDDDDDETEVPSSIPRSSKNGGGRKRRRKKKQSTSALIGNVDNGSGAVKTARRKKRKSKSRKGSGSLALSLSGGGIDVHIPSNDGKGRFTFEVGMNASTSNGMMIKQRPPPINTRQRGSTVAAKSIPTAYSSRQMDSSSAQTNSQLRRKRQSSSILFTSDTNIKAPMHLLSKMNNDPVENGEGE